ncbi:MAG: serpin family protein [Deltaproteobacteria bacterium]|jgi:serpin B|nr:serpin family protein [Deltaproteobacteria bacterium]
MLNLKKLTFKLVLLLFALSSGCKDKIQSLDKNKNSAKTDSQATKNKLKTDNQIAKTKKPKISKNKPNSNLIGISKNQSDKYKNLDKKLLNKAKKTATRINNFSFKLYHELTKIKPQFNSGLQVFKETINLVFSPWSLHMSLSMLAAGAQGETFREIVKVLGIPAKSTSYHEDYKQFNLNLILNSASEKFLLKQSNSIWVEKSCQLKSTFARTLNKNYQSSVSPLDFKTKLEKSRRTINQIVKKQTNGKIAEILAPDSLKQFTKSVLTNAIYLKARWSQKIEKHRSRKRPFYLLNGKKIQVTSMNKEVLVKTYRNKEITAIDLPYENKRFSLLVMMPSLSEFSKVEKKLSTEYLNNIIGSLQKKSFNLYLPKFKIDLKINPRNMLKKMGITSAFGMKADFGKMFSRDNVLVNSIVHKAFIEIDETGTEAAAATVVAISTKGIPMPNTKIVKINRPFFFFLRDRKSGVILFAGRQLNPNNSN